MLPKTTNVLIIGAGPAGLSCALSLLKNGVRDITVVDAQQNGLNISRAITIHAKTLEELDTIDCAEDIVSQGIRSPHMLVRAQQKTLVNLNFLGLPNTRFNCALLISQSETERTLEAHLRAEGIQVIRPYRFSYMEEAKDGVRVFFQEGAVVRAKYVIGADGARSTVRRIASIPFRDPATGKDPYAEIEIDSGDPDKDDARYGLPLIIADVFLGGHIPPCVNQIDLTFFLGPLGFLLLVPLPPAKDDLEGRTVYRISCPPEKMKKEVTIQWLQRVVEAGLGLPRSQTPTVEKIIWKSRFRVRSAVADSFHQRLGSGMVLLVGDAAHVHSPAGGQGMNLGIRDAIALGRVLGTVDAIKSDSEEAEMRIADEMFAKFSVQRRQLAMDVIKITKLMTWATSLRKWWARLLRNWVWAFIGNFPSVYNRITLKLSGLLHN